MEMTRIKAMWLFALLCILLINQLHTCSGKTSTAGEPKIDCSTKCNYRCSKASRHKMCIRACNTCCDRCNCVPPGTFGNKDVCPCYANLTTHGGRHKCP